MSKENEIEKILDDTIWCKLGRDQLSDMVRSSSIRDAVKALTDKFHIIPKTDSPEKWVEITQEKLSEEQTSNHRIIKLKWRGEK